MAAEARWYAIQTYSGHENKVKRLIERRIAEEPGDHPEEKEIQEVIVPTQDVVEIRQGKRVTVTRRLYPGYVLVKMVLNQRTMHIINNIQGTDGEWTTTLSRTRQLVSAGTCAFSVEEDTGDDNGNGSYKVGAQDIVTIISNAIKMYGDGTKVGASGTFECNGNIKKQPHLKWYLYHT